MNIQGEFHFRFGRRDVFSPDGQGVWLDGEGNLMDILQPRRSDQLPIQPEQGFFGISPIDLLIKLEKKKNSSGVTIIVLPYP